MESTKKIYPILARLQFLAEIESAIQIRIQHEKESGNTSAAKSNPVVVNEHNFFKLWEVEKNLLKDKFDLFEPVMVKKQKRFFFFLKLSFFCFKRH